MLPKDTIETLLDEIEEYMYINDETEKWCIKDNAPEWVKKKFKELYDLVHPKTDDKGIVTQY